MKCQTYFWPGRNAHPFPFAGIRPSTAEPCNREAIVIAETPVSPPGGTRVCSACSDILREQGAIFRPLVRPAPMPTSAPLPFWPFAVPLPPYPGSKFNLTSCECVMRLDIYGKFQVTLCKKHTEDVYVAAIKTKGPTGRPAGP